MPRGLVASIGVAMLFVACQSAVPSPPASAQAPRAEAPPTSPLDYVPAAGLRWLIVAHPARILADHELAAAASTVISPDRLHAFTSVTAIDPRQLENLVVAGYDLGTLYVTALHGADAGRARALFEKRLSAGAIVKHPRPDLYRIAGTRDDAPCALVAVGDRVFAYATGDPTLARVAEAYAERRLKSPTALRGASLSTLPPIHDALAVAYFPGPFTGEWSRGAAGLLRDALAVAATLDHAEAGLLRVNVIAAGDWPSGENEPRMATAWTDLSASSTGRLFGLDQAKNVNSVADLHELTWSGDLPLSRLMAGLRAATIANVPEIFDVHAAQQTGPPDEH
jgi:hypothetical protein